MATGEGIVWCRPRCVHPCASVVHFLRYAALRRYAAGLDRRALQLRVRCLSDRSGHARRPGYRSPTCSTRLAGVPQRAGRLVVLVGGEPFLRPDFLHLLAAIRAAGCVPGIVTTGRPLLYPQLRERLRRAGVAYLRVQLFGIGDVHDRAAAVPGAFEQARGGTACLDGRHGRRVRRGRGPVDARPIAAGARRGGRRVWRADVAAERADRDRDRSGCRARGARTPTHCAGRSRRWRTGTTTRAARCWSGRGCRTALSGSQPSGRRVRPSSPARRAPAVSARWRRWRGAAPAAQTRANSFNFVLRPTDGPMDGQRRRVHRARRGGRAPIRTGSCGSSRANGWCSTSPTRGDFAPARSRGSRTSGAISSSTARRPACWTTSPKACGGVLPDAICDPCAHRTQCGRRFRIVEGPPFAREEAWIAGYIAGLRGRVLDVGCGEQLYRDELGPLLRARAPCSYTGLDPDAAQPRAHPGRPSRRVASIWAASRTFAASRRATTTSCACAR